MASKDKEFELLIHAANPEAAKGLATVLIQELKPGFSPRDNSTYIDWKNSPNSSQKQTMVDYGNGNYGFLIVLDHQTSSDNDIQASYLAKAMSAAFEKHIGAPLDLKGRPDADRVDQFLTSYRGQDLLKAAKEPFAANPDQLGYSVVKKVHLEQQIGVYLGAHSPADAKAFMEILKNDADIKTIIGREGIAFAEPVWTERGRYEITMKIPGEAISFDKSQALKSRIKTLADSHVADLPPNTTWNVPLPEGTDPKAVSGKIETAIATLQRSGAIPAHLKPSLNIEGFPDKQVNISFYAQIEDPKFSMGNAKRVFEITDKGHREITIEPVPLSRNAEETANALKTLQQALGTNLTVTDTSRDDFDGYPRKNIDTRVSTMPKELPYRDQPSETTVNNIPQFPVLEAAVNEKLAAQRPKPTVAPKEPEAPAKPQSTYAWLMSLVGFGEKTNLSAMRTDHTNERTKDAANLGRGGSANKPSSN